MANETSSRLWVRDLAASHVGLRIRVGDVEGLFVRPVTVPQGTVEMDGSAVPIPGLLLVELLADGGTMIQIEVNSGDAVQLA